VRRGEKGVKKEGGACCYDKKEKDMIVDWTMLLCLEGLSWKSFGLITVWRISISLPKSLHECAWPMLGHHTLKFRL